MEIKTEIKISEEEIICLIKEKYQIDGDISFIFENTYETGYDGVQQYLTRKVFKGIIFKNLKQI